MKRIGNFICYIIVVLFMGGFAYFFHSYILMLAAFAFFAVPFISFPLLIIASHKLRVSFDLNETVAKRNEEYTLKAEFINRSFVPVTNCNFRLELKNDYSENTQVRYMTVSVPAFGKRVININIKPLMCGRINASVNEVKIMDLMSFFEVKTDVGADFTVNIMPRRLSSDITMLTGENISDDTEKVHKDNAGNEILDIREYVSGDSLKTIHWKVSAKRDELYVKVRGDTSQERTLLLFELNKDDINGILDAVYTQTLRYVKQGLPIKICWAGRGSEQLSSNVVFDEKDIYPMFTQVYNSIASNAEEHTLSVARRQLSGGTVLYISSSEKGVTMINL